MKKIIRIISVRIALASVAAVFSACSNPGSAGKEKVVIWTSGEDYKNEYYLSECRKKFPEYDIELIYLKSSDIAAKVVEEGDSCCFSGTSATYDKGLAASKIMRPEGEDDSVIVGIVCKNALRGLYNEV